MRCGFLLVAVVAVFSILTGCSGAENTVRNAQPSVFALAAAVLDAVQRRDRGTLASLALSEQEFGARVWPELPAARPERNLPQSFVWADLSQKSQSSLTQLLANHAGRRYSLVKVGFLGDTTKYATFAVHRKAELTLKTPEGAELRLRLFGSVIEVDGRFKVFSYVVD